MTGRGPILRCALLGLVGAILLAGPASAATKSPAEEVQPPAGFTLQGSHGYSITVSAYAGEDGRPGRLNITATRGHESASYGVRAKVTADSVRADLGRLGRVDLLLRRTGGDKTEYVKCARQSETHEVATYEGLFEFAGEGGYTRVRATRVAAQGYLRLLAAVRPICGGQSSGESRGPNLRGARLAGISYAHGRVLKFRINKNRPGGKAVFSASLAERRGGIRIFRELSGVAPAGAFRYDRKVRTATLSPPAPFAGSASLHRQENLISPVLTGNLSLAFPGHSVVIDGPAVHVTLVHARLTHGDNASSITAGI